MSKDRPFKSFKTPSERPFKAYNPSNNTSMLFQDPQEQQPLRLGLINGLMQQQQQQQQQQMSFSQQQANAVAQQVYGDPEDYLHLNPQQRGQNPLLNMDSSLSSYYEDLGLDDPENPLIRPDLLVTHDSILQREQDLNIGQSSSSMSITPTFIVPNRHNQRGLAGIPSSLSLSAPSVSMHDSLSMLFDQSQSSMNTFSPTLQQHQQHQLLSKSNTDRICPDGQSANGSHFLNSMGVGSQVGVVGMMGGNGHSNGRSLSIGDILPSSSGIEMDPFPVKREADEGQALTAAESPSPTSIQSPSQSEPPDSLWESPKRNLKRSISNSSSGSANHAEHAALNESSDTGGDSKEEGDPKDPAYLEKRRKNNESAKRSREARRNKEELVALRVISLEEENMKLRAEIGLLDKELDELRTRLFT